MSAGDPGREFAIRLAGQELSAADKGDVLSITVDRGIRLPDRIEVLIKDLNGSWSQENAPDFGSPIEIDMGYIGRLSLVGKGSVAMTEVALKPLGAHEFRIVAYGPRYILQRGVQAKSFVDTTIGDSVSQARGGVTVSVDQGSLSRDHVLQANQPGKGMVDEWASRLGLVVLDEGEEVKLLPADLSTVGPTFEYERDLIEFRVEANTLRQVSEVKVTGVDVMGKAQFSATAGPGQELGLMGGSTSGTDAADQAFGAKTLEVSDLPIKSQEEADKLAEAIYNDRLFSFVTGYGLVRGEPDLKPNTVIKIEKLGTKLSGSYYVTRVTHRYSVTDGFQSSFEVCRPALGG